MLYLITICILITLYVFVIFMMNKFKNVRLTNAIFVATAFVTYVVYVAIVYSIVGAKSECFYGVLPTANVSPFMLTILPIILFSPKSIRKYLFSLVAILSFGMLISPIYNSISYATLHYPFSYLPVMDYVAHLTLSLWGIYLIRSRQVKLNIRDCIIGGIIILVVALVMLLLNLVFDTSFFGLSLKGKHNIYGNILVSSSYLSALIYFLGLTCALVIGYLYCKLLSDRHTDSSLL